MGIKPTARALRNSVLKGAAGPTVASALSRGVETAGQVGASAAEFLRVRRDPAEVARRRHRAAVRRANIWGAGTAIGVAGGAAVTVGLVRDGVTVSAVFALILLLALTVWCALGLVRALRTVRAKARIVRELPPPAPARRPVASAIRAEIARLDSYSDGLRELILLMPDDRSVADLRGDVLGAADEAERLLRRQANEFTLLRKTAAGRDVPASVQATSENLVAHIRYGVEHYGRLVSAATDTVVASAQLNRAVADLQPTTDRLRALSMGMKEIAAHARPPM
ncbi:hypothetical protein SAMN04515671_2979 [Nakamurella panacisegetis]|uniref:Uncharacterized protein n=1 Tax=Nakamurella panacisegetis TaxID=1090615 RepID=A0A1H0Q3I5_9ACTN|nr:hypothetical protein [Nakamurella panacisegetis]SDP11962.1 hypothetical protein SAMN04515671_2979 [Nakamurella panacisegetis]